MTGRAGSTSAASGPARPSSAGRSAAHGTSRPNSIAATGPAGGDSTAYHLGGRMSLRQRVSSGSPFEPTMGYSRAIRVGRRVMVSGTAPVWPDGSCPDDAGLQAERCLAIIATALAEAGAGLSDVVRTRMFLIAAADADAVGAAHSKVFGSIRPASTMVAVAALLDPRWRVEI